MNRIVLIGLLVAILVGQLALLSYLYFNQAIPADERRAVDQAALRSLPGDFKIIESWLKEHAKTHDPRYTYDLLITTQLPPNIDLHLLGHTVGNLMYDQYGLDAMQYCTPDLRNACSHSVVVGALLDNGLAALEDVHAACKKAPGGSGAYTMCFHGFGHGVLAFTEYDFDKAVALCQKVGTPEYQNEEAGQCVGGAVMELRDGVHDRAMWETKIASYINTDNPLGLCQRPSIFSEAKKHCYSYITPFLFDAAGANGGLPKVEHYAPAVAYCEKEPDSVFREQCYAGFGKEFIVLAGSYDIQHIDELPSEVLATAASWCSTASTPDAVRACSLEIVHSLYWGGENNINGAIRYCSVLGDGLQEDCFNTLYSDVLTYQNENHVREVCSLVPAAAVENCLQNGLKYNKESI